MIYVPAEVMPASLFAHHAVAVQRCGLRQSILGQDRPETTKSLLVLVLQVWCCVEKHGHVTLVVIMILIMILKDTATFQVLFIVSLF